MPIWKPWFLRQEQTRFRGEENWSDLGFNHLIISDFSLTHVGSPVGLFERSLSLSLSPSPNIKPYFALRFCLSLDNSAPILQNMQFLRILGVLAIIGCFALATTIESDNFDVVSALKDLNVDVTKIPALSSFSESQSQSQESACSVAVSLPLALFRRCHFHHFHHFRDVG